MIRSWSELDSVGDIHYVRAQIYYGCPTNRSTGDVQDTSFSVHTAVGLLEIISHTNLTSSHAWVTAKGITDVYPGHSFYIPIANFGIADVLLPNYQNVGEVASAPEGISYIKD